MKRLNVLFLMASAILLALGSCRNASEKAAEKMIEESYKDSEGKDVDVDIDREGKQITIETEEGKVVVNQQGNTWPKEIPSEVPQPEKLKIQRVTTSDVQEGKSWTVVYEGRLNLDDYGKRLKSAGFKIATVNMGGSGSINGEKEDLNVALMVGEDQSVLTVFKGEK